jgi:hypothetical protein
MAKREDLMTKIHPRYHAQIEAARNEPRKPLVVALTYAYPLDQKPAPEIEAGTNGVKGRIRQSKEPEMNKLELSYSDQLRFMFPQKEGEPKRVIPQRVRLWLANGAWYKADFFIPEQSLFIEVKGPHAFRGGFEFLKIAAATHRWAKFRLVWRVSGQWHKQEVLP